MLRLPLITCILALSGCALGSSQEIKQAEKLLAHFQCHNIETSQMMHSPIITYHERALGNSRQKVEGYLQSYKDGDILFTEPLPDIISAEYEHYKAACQSLGGLSR
jgi:hypothetical protein